MTASSPRFSFYLLHTPDWAPLRPATQFCQECARAHTRKEKLAVSGQRSGKEEADTEQAPARHPVPIPHPGSGGPVHLQCQCQRSPASWALHPVAENLPGPTAPGPPRTTCAPGTCLLPLQAAPAGMTRSPSSARRTKQIKVDSLLKRKIKVVSRVF